MGGWLSGKNKSKSSQNYSNTTTTTPVEPTQYQGLADLLIKQAMAKMSATTPLEGYEAGGIGTINNAYRLAAMRNQNNLTSRGLSTSPIAGAMDTKMELGRAGEIAGFQNTLPLLQRQLQNEDYAQAMAMYGMRPLGQTSTSSGMGIYTGQPTSTAGALGGAISDASVLLAYLYGSGTLGGKKTGVGIPGINFPAIGG